MTTEQFEQQLQTETATVHYLTDAVADFLLTRGHPAKIGEIANLVGKNMGANAKLIREVLAQSPQFVGEERRWNLSLRTLFHRPVEGALQQTLRTYGKPMAIPAFSNEMAVLNARPSDYFQSLLPAFLSARPQTYFQTPDDRWGLNEWLLDTEALDEEELLLRNFFDTLEDVRPLLEKVAKVRLRAEMSHADAAIALLRGVKEPLNTKVMSYALWRVQGDKFQPLAFYLDLLENERFHLFSGGIWALKEQLDAMPAALKSLSALADVALEEEETWEGPYAATEEDLHEIYDFMVEHTRPFKLSDLIETVMEYSRSSARYSSIFEGLTTALNEDPRFQLVGQQTWTPPMLIPQQVLQVPEALLPETVDPSVLADPETDAELEDEGLENNLAVWVHDPRYEDFGGEHEVELSPELMSGASTLDETRIPLLFDHHEMGTLKLRQADMAFFPTDTPLACVSVHSEKIGDFQIWINNEELLIHGLADWYRQREVPVGAMVTFRRGEEPDDFLITWDGDIDPLIALSDDRVAELLDLREPAEEEHWSVYDIMRHALAGHPEGAHFLTLWAEVNVVRRTPKRVVASNLSSYHCFALISGTENWRLDERKVEQGRKKTKKKYIIE